MPNNPLTEQLVELARLKAQIDALSAQASTLEKQIKYDWLMAEEASPLRHPALTTRTTVSYETAPVLERVQVLRLPYVKPTLDRAAFNKAVLAGQIADDRLLNEVDVTIEAVFVPRWQTKL